MADTIKIGNLEIDNLKVGTLSVDALYIGDMKIYPSTPPEPTPTYEWKQYNAGDTVPSKLFYGVKLGDPSMDTTSIEFGDTFNTGIAFTFDVNSEYGWYAQDLSGEQIDISEYYDETERCFIIYFSDLGFGAMPISYPIPNDSFEFDVKLYEEHTPTLQWVTFSAGDTIPQGNVYGFKGDSQIVGNGRYDILEIGTDSNNCVTFGHGAPTRAPQYTAYFYLVSNGTPSYVDSWDYGLGTFIFSDYASNGVEEYYYEDGTKTMPFDCQLYIYA